MNFKLFGYTKSLLEEKLKLFGPGYRVYWGYWVYSGKRVFRVEGGGLGGLGFLRFISFRVYMGIGQDLWKRQP